MSVFAAVVLGAAVSLAIPLKTSTTADGYLSSNQSAPFGPLTLQPDGTFQISILEDLHFGESMFSKTLFTYIITHQCVYCRCLGSMGPAAGYQFGQSDQ